MTVSTEPSAREQIQSLLDAHRPDRYDPADHDWRRPVVGLIAAEITVEEAKLVAAERLVSNAEATATKRTNRMLREIADSGNWPLDWLGAMDWPLAVDDNLRVALRAATVDDLKHFAERERRAAANDFAARNAACEGALAVAEAMGQQGVLVASEVHVDPDTEVADR